MDARRVGHVLVDDLGDAVGGHRFGQFQGRAHRFLDRAARKAGIEVHGAAGEALWVDAAQGHVGVGDGGRAAATRVARRSGLGTGALRPDSDALGAVDAGDGATAGADLHHFDDGDAQGQSAALQEARRAVYLEGARRLRLVIVDQAYLRGGTAHVEGQHTLEAALAGDA